MARRRAWQWWRRSVAAPPGMRPGSGGDGQWRHHQGVELGRAIFFTSPEIKKDHHHGLPSIPQFLACSLRSQSAAGRPSLLDLPPPACRSSLLRCSLVPAAVPPAAPPYSTVGHASLPCRWPACRRQHDSARTHCAHTGI
jgi:hypothetical protein